MRTLWLTGISCLICTPLQAGIISASDSTSDSQSTADAKKSVTVEYLPAQDDFEASLKAEIEASGINNTLIDLSEQIFPFNSTLLMQYGGEEGPMYDPATHTVHIPYSFYAESIDYFTKNKYDEKYNKPAQLGAIDTLLHTLLHEAGHAYIEDQNIAILGKEEDAVDNFATIVLLNYIDGGDDAAISAADMFAFESEDRPDYYDFGEYIDEHSFDLQRYFSTLCLVYGSDPEKHTNLLNEVENNYLSDRKDFCIFNYETINQNWQQHLNL
ncbi:DUF4344 domain-containing metallopeptidase [Vibrio sp. 99-70-13A1]|uniref:DUF4344 domain-containing metallopeptidase n=1 Tax=Vibrio sp. 99-70-13A1 TaxID=2607601 RepID=UPI0014938511|nr:DUF4344 domain-containing metallopeptidase [Vibrio sp. 99-70-13A1]NOH95991.1 hypothetical protein [Vibrio sp. 99-70-13A1]